MTPAHVRRAVAIYLEQAFPEACGVESKVRLSDLERASTLEELLQLFQTPRRDAAPGLQRFTLRLGNWRYPFMKFVVQEYLVDAEYFFTVDTHDDLDVKPGAPDYERWLELKVQNRELKERIEYAWRLAGLPTFEELRVLCEGLRGVEREARKRKRLLLVDDERSVAQGLGALLEGRGYDVELCYSGEQVLERLARDPLPDLLLLDYELPRLDGGQVLASLHADPRLAQVPVLMLTASAIDLTQLQHVRGLLRKPYPRALLFKLLAELLGGGDESA
ncbi:MAG TPA: response regulator [Planctomycetota bacterium]|nr:response regulator [Planctomycetota bacterium]